MLVSSRVGLYTCRTEALPSLSCAVSRCVCTASTLRSHASCRSTRRSMRRCRTSGRVSRSVGSSIADCESALTPFRLLRCTTFRGGESGRPATGATPEGADRGRRRDRPAREQSLPRPGQVVPIRRSPSAVRSDCPWTRMVAAWDVGASAADNTDGGETLRGEGEAYRAPLHPPR